MAAVTSILVGAAAAAGVAGTAINVNQQRKAAKQQRRAEERAELEAKNAAALEQTRTDTGAKVRLGSTNASGTRAAKTSTATANRRGTVGNSVGGLGASASLGL